MEPGTIKLLAGCSNFPLAEEIANYIGVKPVDAIVNCFPDGETFVQVQENVRGADVFIVQSTSYPANHNIMELLIMIDAVRRSSASRITAVIPFYGYARQDRKDKPRVPITSKLVANLLVAAGANRIIAMDLHSPQITGFFDIPVDHLFAMPVFKRYLSHMNVDNLVVASPDIGGTKVAAAYADMFACPLVVVAKRRTGPNTVQTIHLIGEVEGKDVLIVDDITESGGTLANAAKLLRQSGAKSVRAIISHCVLNEKGYERFSEKGLLDEIITTNSTMVETRNLPITTLSIAELFGEAILRIHHNESVTDLFKIKGF